MKKKNKHSRTFKKNKHKHSKKCNNKQFGGDDPTQFILPGARRPSITRKSPTILIQNDNSKATAPVPVSPSSVPASPSSVPVSPSSVPVSPSSVPVSPVSAPVSPSSVPVSPVSAPVSPVSAPARPSVSASPLPATDDLSMDVTDQTHTRMAEQYLMEANARAEQDATEAANNAKLALKSAQTAGHVPYIKPADFFQQIQDMQTLFNMGKTSPDLKFLGNIIKYQLLKKPPTNNSLYELKITSTPSPNASPKEFQSNLQDQDKFPVSVLLRCDEQKQIRAFYAVTSTTSLTVDKDVKSNTYTISKLAKIQSKQEYDQQNAGRIQKNAEHIANLRKLTAYQKYDAEPPQDIMLKHLSPTSLEQGIVPPIKATDTDIMFSPVPGQEDVISSLANYIRINNTTSYLLSRLHMYYYEAPPMKSLLKWAATTTTKKGGKKSRKIRKIRRRKRFTHKHNKHNKHKPCRRNGTRRNHARKNPIRKI